MFLSWYHHTRRWDHLMESGPGFAREAFIMPKTHLEVLAFMDMNEVTSFEGLDTFSLKPGKFLKSQAFFIFKRNLEK